MQTPRFPEVFVQLTGVDGNAFTIMANVVGALRDAADDDGMLNGEPVKDIISQYRTDAMSGSYDDLLRTTMELVEVG